jgi:hypothetical protein
MKVPYIPKELLNIILEYDGGINYKNGKYVNIIHKNNTRYNIIKSIINKKIEVYCSSFYFEFGFDICKSIGLCYDYNFSYNKFEICYYDWRNNGIKQIRTYL